MARNKMRQRYQRLFNHKIHSLNHSIAEDPLWKGRFVFRQKNAIWWQFEDNSGGELSVFIRAYDKKTGYYHDYRLDYAPWNICFNWNLTMKVANKFIVEDLDVWKEDPRPNRKTAEDYTRIKVNHTDLMSKPWNFYTSYKEKKGE